MIAMKEVSMEAIDIKRFGLAFGATLAIFYLGCVFVMATVSREATIHFFNSLLHGIDFTPIIRSNIPVWEMVIGITEMFILGWFTGARIASIYNFALTKKGEAHGEQKRRNP
jgi:hypothetical protein